MMKITSVLMFLLFAVLAHASSIQALINSAKPGFTVELNGGIYKGAIVINKPLKLICKKGAVIDGQGKGDVITVKDTKNVIIENCTIRNSGIRGWKMDSGLKLINVENSTIKGNRIDNCLYGIVIKKSENNRIVDNEISSKMGYSEGAKGDAIRLWWSPSNLVEDNYIHDSRDITSMFSNNVVFKNNKVVNSHIGALIIYSNGNKIMGFMGENNKVNIVLNAAEDILIKDFYISNRGKNRGIDLIEASNTVISDGYINGCNRGLIINLSPSKAHSKNLFNNIRLSNNYIAIYFHATENQRSRNILENIVFKDNKMNLVDESKTHR